MAEEWRVGDEPPPWVADRLADGRLYWSKKDGHEGIRVKTLVFTAREHGPEGDGFVKRGDFLALEERGLFYRFDPKRRLEEFESGRPDNIITRGDWTRG